mmetsp:Transcript_15346/g.50401  ORF Transcript_15346/g.50401 Transcript_15346/m.50401 type:complete len:227 (+) Transcript_15346:61-741(+)
MVCYDGCTTHTSFSRSLGRIVVARKLLGRLREVGHTFPGAHNPDAPAQTFRHFEDAVLFRVGHGPELTLLPFAVFEREPAVLHLRSLLRFLRGALAAFELLQQLLLLCPRRLIIGVQNLELLRRLLWQSPVLLDRFRRSLHALWRGHTHVHLLCCSTGRSRLPAVLRGRSSLCCLQVRPHQLPELRSSFRLNRQLWLCLCPSERIPEHVLRERNELRELLLHLFHL